MRGRFRAGLVCSLLVPVGAFAEGVAQERLPQSRAPLGEAIRESLVANPRLLPARMSAPRAPIDLYSEDAARDLDILDRAAPRLFDPARSAIGPATAPIRIAIFTRADCADCATALQELRGLAGRLGFRATVLDIDEHADLAGDLGLDVAPSYAMPDRLLRGAMPDIVLERYLTE